MFRDALKVIAVFFIGAAGGFFSDQVLGHYFFIESIENPLSLEYSLEHPVQVTETKEIFIQENTALENAIQKTEKIIVGIETKTKKGAVARGSGLIVTSDGLILTLAELVPENFSVITVWAEGVPYYSSAKNGDIKILKKDLKNNLCLIKIEAANLNTAGFFDCSKIKLGQRVFSFENVFQAKGAPPNLAVSQGIIRYFDSDFVYTDIRGWKTAAGSPLFSIEGQIIGINFLDEQRNLITIPSSVIRDFLGF